LNWSATASATATAANAKRPGNMSHNPQLTHFFAWLQEIGSKQIEGENLLLVAQTKIHENKAGGVMKVMKIYSFSQILFYFSQASLPSACQCHPGRGCTFGTPIREAASGSRPLAHVPRIWSH